MEIAKIVWKSVISVGRVWENFTKYIVSCMNANWSIIIVKIVYPVQSVTLQVNQK